MLVYQRVFEDELWWSIFLRGVFFKVEAESRKLPEVSKQEALSQWARTWRRDVVRSPGGPRCDTLWHVYRLCSAFLVLMVDSPDFSGERVTPNTSSSFQAEIRAVKHRVATSTVFFIRLWVPKEVCVRLHSPRLDIVEDSSCLIQ